MGESMGEYIDYNEYKGIKELVERIIGIFIAENLTVEDGVKVLREVTAIIMNPAESEAGAELKRRMQMTVARTNKDGSVMTAKETIIRNKYDDLAAKTRYNMAAY